MPGTAPRAQTPRNVNHIVLNVRDLEASHRFWTEIIGFRCVAELKPRPGRTLKMRFYSGIDEHGDVNHHDLALAQLSGEVASEPVPWTLEAKRPGVNHIAITYPDRESWLKQVEFLQERGVTFHRRINHGMTHSVYISDPDGHGVEVLYELPREVWGEDIDAAQNYSVSLPTDGAAALVDTTDNPMFGTEKVDAV